MGLLELETQIEFYSGISTICLSSASTEDLEGHAVSLSGWGSTTFSNENQGKPSKFLRSTNQLRVTSVTNCRNRIGFLTYAEFLYVSVFNRTTWLKNNPFNGEKSMDALICIEDQEENGLAGSCGGDSGSPVVEREFLIDGSTRYQQIGIVSGGRCSNKETPSILTHIGHKGVYKFIFNISKFII